jgi:hypothetical protein
MLAAALALSAAALAAVTLTAAPAKVISTVPRNSLRDSPVCFTVVTSGLPDGQSRELGCMI